MSSENLIIIGAGAYGAVALEIASDMGCFDKIDFVDDGRKIAANGKTVIGTSAQLEELSDEYNNMIVAIGNPELRLSLLKKIEKKQLKNRQNVKDIYSIPRPP
jgi:FlaA1/EpsC-like NDP-sugar epimerase